MIANKELAFQSAEKEKRAAELVIANKERAFQNELLKRADIAMYQAKKAGRNTLRFFNPKMQEVINARTSL